MISLLSTSVLNLMTIINLSDVFLTLFDFYLFSLDISPKLTSEQCPSAKIVKNRTPFTFLSTKLLIYAITTHEAFFNVVIFYNFHRSYLRWRKMLFFHLFYFYFHNEWLFNVSLVLEKRLYEEYLCDYFINIWTDVSDVFCLFYLWEWRRDQRGDVSYYKRPVIVTSREASSITTNSNVINTCNSCRVESICSIFTSHNWVKTSVIFLRNWCNNEPWLCLICNVYHANVVTHNKLNPFYFKIFKYSW